MDEGKNETAAWRDPKTNEIYPIFTRGQNPNVYIKGEDGEYERGKVWPYYPGIYADDLIQCDDCDEWNENVGNFHSEVKFFEFREYRENHGDKNPGKFLFPGSRKIPERPNFRQTKISENFGISRKNKILSRNQLCSLSPFCNLFFTRLTIESS